MDENLQQIVLEAIKQYSQSEQARQEPVYKTELVEERKRRESLEGRVNQLIEENRKARAIAARVEKEAMVRAELQRLGVSKIDLAFKAVKDDILRSDEGMSAGPDGENRVREYLANFVAENPELLPARIPGGSGASGVGRSSHGTGIVDFDRIRPGMSSEELERFREEVARVANQTMRGL
ncbi:hypothetical protein F183_A44020 [Bryobacterales bacterium F-183]|nr:hypothetical protein F183_A44020 [Bryobacterales bacterium F-183]